MRGTIVTLDDYIDSGLTLQLSARETLRVARACGLVIRNADWFEAWRERQQLHEDRRRAA